MSDRVCLSPNQLKHELALTLHQIISMYLINYKCERELLLMVGEDVANPVNSRGVGDSSSLLN